MNLILAFCFVADYTVDYFVAVSLTGTRKLKSGGGIGRCQKHVIGPFAYLESCMCVIRGDFLTRLARVLNPADRPSNSRNAHPN